MIEKIAKKILKKTDKNYLNNFEKRKNFFPKAREHLLNNLIKRGLITKSAIGFYAILITFFGCGKIKYASGTFTSLVTVIIWFFVTSIFFDLGVDHVSELIFWLIISAVLFVYGVLYIPIYAKNLGEIDHSSIVIDEVVGQLVALCITYFFIKKYYFDDTWFLSKLIMFGHIFASFIVFRFFDIIKPSFIGWIDQNIKNSFGVMFDDLVCGLVTAGVNITVFFVFENAVLKLHNTLV